jgi:hypothetical protein
MVIPMNKQNSHIFAFALIFLFFIQMAGILIESIYILDLMNTSLDAKVLGLLSLACCLLRAGSFHI